ncbi:MAG: type II secretion system protein GspG, partial [Acidobacteriota bacterium]
MDKRFRKAVYEANFLLEWAVAVGKGIDPCRSVAQVDLGSQLCGWQGSLPDGLYHKGEKPMKKILTALMLAASMGCAATEPTPEEARLADLEKKGLAVLGAMAERATEIAEERDKREIAKVQLAELEGALDLFRFDVGRYPSGAEGLQVLIDGGGIENWGGPYLKKITLP